MIRYIPNATYCGSFRPMVGRPICVVRIRPEDNSSFDFLCVEPKGGPLHITGEDFKMLPGFTYADLVTLTSGEYQAVVFRSFEEGCVAVLAAGHGCLLSDDGKTMSDVVAEWRDVYIQTAVSCFASLVAARPLVSGDGMTDRAQKALKAAEVLVDELRGSKFLNSKE